ncbi:MAG: hypothetical protein MRY83_09745 [Flavobacteriales bacterium]|nr:hypothetical protein [Flavobacteriales bacterium]
MPKIKEILKLCFVWAILSFGCNQFINESANHVNNLGAINLVLNKIQDDLYDNMDDSRKIGINLRKKNFRRIRFDKLRINEIQNDVFDQAISAKNDLPPHIQTELGNNIEDLKKYFTIAQQKAQILNNEIDAGNYQKEYDKILNLNHEVHSYFHGLSELVTTIGEVTDKYYKQFELEALPSGDIGNALRRMILDRHSAQELFHNLAYYYEKDNLKKAERILKDLEKDVEEHKKEKLDHDVLGVSYDLYYSQAMNNFINDSKNFVKEAQNPNLSQSAYDKLYDDILGSYNGIIDSQNSFNEIEASLPY